MARKILLAEIVGPSVTTLTPIAWNPADKAATLTLSNSNFTASPSSTAFALVRLAQSITVATYVEFVYNRACSTPNTGFGLATSAASLTLQCGAQITSWGYINNGNIANNNALSPGFPTLTTGDVVGMAVDPVAGKIWWSKNGVWLGTGNPSLGLNPQYANVTSPVFIAASPLNFGGGADIDTVTVVTDPALMQFAAPAGFIAGKYSSATVAGSNYYFASEGFTTSPTDTPANQYYDGRIAPDGDPIYDRSVSCCVWNPGSSSGQSYSDAPGTSVSAATVAIGDMDLLNTDGALDTLVQTPMRDGTITLKLGYYGNAYSTFTPVATGIIDDIGAADEHTARVYLRGKLAKIDKAAQTNVYNAAAPNAALESYPVPVAFGTCKWVPLVTLDPANLEYQLGDSWIGAVSEVRDQGVLLTQGVGWSASVLGGLYPLGQFGIRRLTNPAGRQCATFDGEVTLGAALVAAEPFGTWAAGDPPGFAHVAGANCTFTNPSGTLASLQCTVANAAQNSTLQATAACVSGQLYVCEIVVSAWTSGSASVMVQPGAGAIVATTSFCEITKAGTYRFAFTAANTNRPIGIQWGKNVCNMQISGLKITAATKIERLPAVVTYLAVTRGGLVAGDIDTAGTLAALDTAAPYTLGFYAQDSTRIPDILQQVADSFTGWFFEDRFGVLKAGRLQAPSATAVLSLTDTELLDDITYETDKAPGLSAVLAGVKNYSVHGTSDIAGSVYVPGSGDPTTAAQLQMPWLALRKGVGTLANLYAQTAANNAAQGTLLTSALNVATESNRRVGVYNVQRGFYRCKAFLDDTTTYTLNPGDTVNVKTGTQPNTHQRYDLNPTTGKNLLVIGVKSRFLSNVVELLLWG